ADRCRSNSVVGCTAAVHTGITVMNDAIRQHEEQLDTMPGSTERVDLLNRLAEQVYYYDVQKALAINREAEQLARNLHYTRGLALSLLQQAYCNHQLSDNETALKQLFLVLPLFEQEGDTWSGTNTLKLIGDIHHKTANYS